MKPLNHFILLIILLLFSDVSYSLNIPTATNPFGIEISIGTRGSSVDAVAYNNVRRLIGNAEASGLIDKVVYYGYGIKDGFSACIEAAPGLVPSDDFNVLVNSLTAIFAKTGTSYSVKRVLTCPTLPTAAAGLKTVQVAKLDGSTVCDVVSGIALTTMQGELKGINVYAAHKLSDAVVRPAGCGTPSGKYNIYEIATTDLSKALSLGFVEWKNIPGNLTLPLAMTTYALANAVYVCFNKEINRTPYCYKYQISPIFKYITRTLGVCPVNPAKNNCP